MRNKYNYFADMLVFILLLVSCASVVYTYVFFKQKGESKEFNLLFNENGTIYRKKDLLQPFSYSAIEMDKDTNKFTTETLRSEASYTSQLATDYLNSILNFDYLGFNLNDDSNTHHINKIKPYFYNDEAFLKFKSQLKDLSFSSKQQEYRLFTTAVVKNPMELVNEGTFKSNRTTRTVQLDGVYGLYVFSNANKTPYSRYYTLEITVIMSRVDDMKFGNHYKIVQIMINKVSEGTI